MTRLMETYYLPTATMVGLAVSLDSISFSVFVMLVCVSTRGSMFN